MNETQDTSGRVLNQLSINTQTPLSQTEYTVDIENSGLLSSGMLLEYNATDQIKLDMFQVPIGLTYLYEQKKINFYGTAGFMLNTFRITDYRINIELQNTEGIPIQVLSYSPRLVNTENSLFFSLFGELGINVPISDRWGINIATKRYYNFLSNNNLNSNAFRNGASWKLGLGYQF